MFVMTGVAHFVNPLRRDLIAIVPPRLPALRIHFAPLAGSAGDRHRRAGAARRGRSAVPADPGGGRDRLCVLMLAMFPANVYAARMPNPPKSMTTRLPLRTVEQVVFVGAALVVGLGGVQ